MRYFGFWRAMRELTAACWQAMRELLPARRKARFGDLDYDWEHDVDTTRSNIGFRAQLLAELAGRPYFASDPWLFEEMMRALALRIQQSAPSMGGDVSGGLQEFTFIDLGSGKGRALLMAAPYGFKRIIGVEFMPEWHRAAEENIRKFAAANPSTPPMESTCIDARDFKFPSGPLVVYLFNSFPEPVFVAVMERLRRSWMENQRPVFVAYRYIEFETLLNECEWLENIASTEQWAVYKAIG
ncbi:MAG TPA: class I SAM-dependent methyltransferase [Candidatus Angelobacter sp.]